MEDKTAVIYNNYFLTAGGGERSALDVALALDNLGYNIVLATAQICNCKLTDIIKPFGLSNVDHWKLLEFESEDDLSDWVVQQECDVFVNHTYGSFMPSPVALGLYMVMFPQNIGETEKENLATYRSICSNSEFTKNYVSLRWGDNLPIEVLVPPVASKRVSKVPGEPSEKEKLIIVVGRFNVNGHNKKQLDAILSFASLRNRGWIDETWRLVVVGHVNDSEENHAYVEKCRQTARGYNIEVRPNVSYQELQDLYCRACCLWQFTGFGLDFGELPEHCEHLGLVALDCFLYGVIPMAYHRSGISLILNHGIDGYSFGSVSELGEIMRLTHNNFGSQYHRYQFDSLQQRTDEFSFESFQQKVANQIANCIG